MAERSINRNGALRSGNNFQALEIFFVPASLHLDHRPESPDGEGVSTAVGRHRYAPAVGMTETLMRSGLADEEKSIPLKCCDDFPGSECANTAVVDSHGLNRDCDTGILLRN